MPPHGRGPPEALRYNRSSSYDKEDPYHRGGRYGSYEAPHHAPPPHNKPSPPQPRVGGGGAPYGPPPPPPIGIPTTAPPPSQPQQQAPPPYDSRDKNVPPEHQGYGAGTRDDPPQQLQQQAPPPHGHPQVEAHHPAHRPAYGAPPPGPTNTQDRPYHMRTGPPPPPPNKSSYDPRGPPAQSYSYDYDPRPHHRAGGPPPPSLPRRWSEEAHSYDQSDSHNLPPPRQPEGYGRPISRHPSQDAEDYYYSRRRAAYPPYEQERPMPPPPQRVGSHDREDDRYQRGPPPPYRHYHRSEDEGPTTATDYTTYPPPSSSSLSAPPPPQHRPQQISASRSASLDEGDEGEEKSTGEKSNVEGDGTKEKKTSLPTQIDSARKDDIIIMGCTCKKSKCLKLYCQCFAASIMCGANCRCMVCHNTPQHEQVRKEAIKGILGRNPSAFDTKFKQTAPAVTASNPKVAHKLGCKCRKSA
eukprot:scaffold120869_cov45-Attheya_sp.AAC.1